jgi:hypothetical protein
MLLTLGFSMLSFIMEPPDHALHRRRAEPSLLKRQDK